MAPSYSGTPPLNRVTCPRLSLGSCQVTCLVPEERSSLPRRARSAFVLQRTLRRPGQSCNGAPKRWHFRLGPRMVNGNRPARCPRRAADNRAAARRPEVEEQWAGGAAEVHAGRGMTRRRRWCQLLGPERWLRRRGVGAPLPAGGSRASGVLRSRARGARQRRLLGRQRGGTMANTLQVRRTRRGTLVVQTGLRRRCPMGWRRAGYSRRRSGI